MRTYLDYQSAKPVDPEVVQAMLPYFNEHFGNPSALHGAGDAATELLEASRRTVAEFINADPEEIIFTSGATESNNLALIGYAQRNKKKGNHIIISEAEHISILNLAKALTKEGFEVTRIPLDPFGQISLKKLEARLRKETILVSIGYASNEIGSLQPIEEIGKLCREKGIAFHSDGVAAGGLFPIDVKRDNLDLLTLSSNDLYGPKGLGILYKRKEIRIKPQLIGGGQEGGLRSGSENLAAIGGLKKAIEILMEQMDKETERFRRYQHQLIQEISTIPHSYLNGHPEERLSNNVHFRFDGIEGESLLLKLRDLGIDISTGSACSSKTLEPSNTLIATGLLHEEAHGSLEITVGRFTQQEDIDKILRLLPEVVFELRKLSPLYKD